MMKKNIIIILVLFVFTGFMHSCDDDFIDKEPPSDVSFSKALSSYSNLSRSTNALYANFMASSMFGEYMVLAPDAMSDNLVLSGTTGRYNRELNLTFAGSDSPSGTFSTSYFVITAACNVINRIESGDFDRELATDAEIDYIKGEALFIRGLVHFQLCNFFAQHYTFADTKIAPGADGKGGHLGIPIVLEFKVSEPARNTVKEVYEQVISDLSQAVTLMNGDAKDGAFKASSNAAKALLSRVYLYKEDWANAAKMADEVISSQVYGLNDVATYEQYWIEVGHKATVFEIQVDPVHDLWTGGSNNVGGIYLYYKDLAASNNLLNLYDDSDIRKKLIKRDGSGSVVNYVWKYPGRTSTPEAVNYQVNNPKIVRFAEMFLNRAEANFRASTSVGDSPLKDINFLRSKRGLSDLLSVSDEDIALERRKELAFEGHRLFDLMRNKKDNIRPEIAARPKVTYPSNLLVCPIPLYEMDNNDNMIQNDGY